MLLPAAFSQEPWCSSKVVINFCLLKEDKRNFYHLKDLI